MFRVGVDASTLVSERTGVGNYVYELLTQLVKKDDWEFILYSNKEIHFPSRKNVKFVRHSPSRKGPAWVNSQLLFDLKRDPVDVFWGGNGYLPIWLPNKTASVVTVHDLVYKLAGATMPFVSRWSRRVFQPKSVGLADRVIAVSHATDFEMTTAYGRKADLIINPLVSSDYGIPNSNYVSEVKKKYELHFAYLLVLGTLEPRKNLKALIRAYLEESNEGTQLPFLVIAGGKGWLEGELPELCIQAEQQGIAKRLGFVPYEDMKGLYAGAQALIFPSLHEGFGMPVVEAQLCGSPVMVSDIPSLQESSGGLAVAFPPTKNGIQSVLRDLAKGELPLACRLHSTIDNSAVASAKVLASLITEAYKEKTK